MSDLGNLSPHCKVLSTEIVHNSPICITIELTFPQKWNILYKDKNNLLNLLDHYSEVSVIIYNILSIFGIERKNTL